VAGAMVMDIMIRKFDPSKMADNRTVMIIGKRNTGKSVLTKDIMRHKRHIPMGMAMSGTEEGNGWYAKWVPDTFVYPDFDRGAVQKLIRRQRQLARRGEGLPPATFLVLDDCIFDRKVMRDEVIRQLFMNGRHWNIFMVVTSQYVAEAPPAIRGNCDYVFIMRENVYQNRERLWKMFFGVFPTLDDFSAALTKCTENYGCLVLDNTVQSNRLEDCVFWYKADPRADFRMGSPLMWHYHSRHYNPYYDNEAPAAGGAKAGAKRRPAVKMLGAGARPGPRKVKRAAAS
jgi:hypothetical protein